MVQDYSPVRVPDSGIPHTSPDKIHDDFMAMIHRIIDERVDARMPIMGNVVGGDGGKLRVHVDDEDEPRTEGFPKKLGQRYKAGDRVMLIPSRSGELVVMGGVSSSDGAAQKVVGNPDLEDDSVDDKVLKTNSVKGDHLQGSAVDTPKIKDGSVTPAKLSQKYASDTHGHGNEYASSGHSHGNEYAKEDHNHGGYADQGDLDKLETSLKKFMADNYQKK